MLQRRKGEAATFVATLFWGSSFVAIKMGLEHIDPIPFVVMRFLFASLFFTLIFLAKRRTFRTPLFRNKHIYLMAACYTGGVMFQYLGLSFTSAIKGSLLININVIFVMGVAHLYLGERVTRQRALSVIGGVIGIFLLVTEGDLGALQSGTLRGDLIVLLGGAFWAIYIVLTRKVVNEGASILELNYIVVLLSTALLTPFLWGFEFDITGSNLLFILYVVLFCTILAFLLWTYGLKTVSATASSVMLMNEVVFATILGIILLGERLNAYGCVGALIMLLAIANISLEQKPESSMHKSQ